MRRLVVLASLVAACSIPSEHEAETASALATTHGFGVSVHSLDPTRAPEYASIGFEYVRMDLFWANVETDGEFDFSEYDPFVAALQANGITPILILDYGHPDYQGGAFPTSRHAIHAFARFAAAAAAHFPGVWWEIWNEPNWTAAPWPTAPAADYVRLARRAGAAIRGVDPSATILGPAFGGEPGDYTYLEECFALGLLEVVDKVSVHPYAAGNPEYLGGYFSEVRARIAAVGPIRPVVATEWGYSSHGFAEGEIWQAALLVRGIDAHVAAGVTPAIIYDFIDDGTDPTVPSHFMGLRRHDGSIKPSYGAVRDRLIPPVCVPSGTACVENQVCDVDTCGNASNCHLVPGVCGYCPLTCEEGGMHGPDGLEDCGPPYPCNNCDEHGVRYCTRHVPFGTGCVGTSPPYCFVPY